MSTLLPLDELQPSQLLLDRDRLVRVLEWFDPDRPALDPLPVIPGTYLEAVPDGAMVLSDGHTRAVACVLAGIETIDVEVDRDLDELDLGVYDTCVGWCVEDGVTEPADLIGRLVSRQRFLEAWVARCEALGEE